MAAAPAAADAAAAGRAPLSAAVVPDAGGNAANRPRVAPARAAAPSSKPPVAPTAAAAGGAAAARRAGTPPRRRWRTAGARESMTPAPGPGAGAGRRPAAARLPADAGGAAEVHCLRGPSDARQEGVSRPRHRGDGRGQDESVTGSGHRYDGGEGPLSSVSGDGILRGMLQLRSGATFFVEKTRLKRRPGQITVSNTEGRQFRAGRFS